ncbi:MAG: DNA alkylation repair protein [Gemmatimonadetes bacterium]|nr:DNA alkylation repair protein [Gemmatimonadota bacterium]
MAEPLKHHIGPEVVRSLATDLAAAWAGFDAKAFIRDASRGLDALELLPRGTHIAGAMRRHLPAAYPEAVRVLVDSLGPPLGGSDLTGMAVFRYLPYVAFIREYGVEHFEESMAAQYVLTQRFTAEWCIRPFVERYPDATLARLREWTRDPNVHVRRLVSEGTRPRLPWAPQLKAFIADPAPTLALLELLKDDPERYVQRSVANHLNDIAKDHPDRVVAVAKEWSRGASEGRAWIVSHALRSLIKRGHRGALALLGGGARPAVRVGRATFTPARVRVGQVVRFTFALTSTARRTQELIVDYTVHFVKADGSAKPKVFKLAKRALAPGERATFSGRVSLAVHTTRKPYPGRHPVEVQVNGIPYPLGAFQVSR